MLAQHGENKHKIFYRDCQLMLKIFKQSDPYTTENVLVYIESNTLYSLMLKHVLSGMLHSSDDYTVCSLLIIAQLSLSKKKFFKLISTIISICVRVYNPQLYESEDVAKRDKLLQLNTDFLFKFYVNQTFVNIEDPEMNSILTLNKCVNEVMRIDENQYFMCLLIQNLTKQLK